MYDGVIIGTLMPHTQIDDKIGGWEHTYIQVYVSQEKSGYIVVQLVLYYSYSSRDDASDA